MSAPDDSPRGQPRDRDSKAVYERILGIVDENTGSVVPETPQPAAIRRATVLTHADNAGIGLDDARDALQAAVENDDLVSWWDGDGGRRYCRRTERAMWQATEWIAQQDDPDRDVISRLTEYRARLNDADSTT